MAKALSIEDVILGEAAYGTAAERYRDMLGIASVIDNRARMLGVTPEQVVSRHSKFNAYGKALPAGVNKYRDLARSAIWEVQTAGPVTNAAFYATPAAKHNLPGELQKVSETTGHQYFTDPKMRAINTAVGFRQPQQIPAQVPVPHFAQRTPTTPSLPDTALAYAPTRQPANAAQAIDMAFSDPRYGLSLVGSAPLGQVASAALGPTSGPMDVLASMRAAGLEKVDDIVTDALLNPGRARVLLAKPTPQSEAATFRMLGRLYRTGAMATIGTTATGQGGSADEARR